MDNQLNSTTDGLGEKKTDNIISHINNLRSVRRPVGSFTW